MKALIKQMYIYKAHKRLYWQMNNQLIFKYLIFKVEYANQLYLVNKNS